MAVNHVKQGGALFQSMHKTQKRDNKRESNAARLAVTFARGRLPSDCLPNTNTNTNKNKNTKSKEVKSKSITANLAMTLTSGFHPVLLSTNTGMLYHGHGHDIWSTPAHLKRPQMVLS